MKQFKALATVLAAISPLIANAAPMLDTVSELYGKIQSLLQLMIQILMLAAGVVFAWGIIQYLGAGPDEKKVVNARKYMIFGIISLAVMLSAWTLAYILLDTFDIQ